MGWLGLELGARGLAALLGQGQAGLAIGDLIGLGGLRAARGAHAAAQMGAPDHGGFTGWAEAETAGWPVAAAQSADELLALVEGLPEGSSAILECAWTGESATAGRMLGPITDGYAADPASDWGKGPRPGTRILVRPAAGQAPTLVGTYDSGYLDLLGVSWIEFRDMGFRNEVRLSSAPNRLVPTVAAFRRCTFRQSHLNAVMQRSIHAEDCLFEDCGSVTTFSCEYNRFWNNVIRDHRDGDAFACRGFTDRARCEGWDVKVWIAGTVFHSMQGIASEAHFDFYQSSSSNEEWQRSLSQLIEFNIYCGDPGNAASHQTQGIFSDDYNPAAPPYRGEWMVHNNLMVMTNTHGTGMLDLSDDAGKWVHRNLYMRAGTLPDSQRTDDPAPTVWAYRAGQPRGTGFMVVDECYVGTISLDEVNDGRNHWDNVLLAPTMRSAPSILSGNGTWDVDGQGRLIYVRPDVAAGIAPTDTAAARAAILAFLRPLVGWRGEGVGPVDPDRWPRAFADIPPGGGHGRPDPFRGGQWGLVSGDGAVTATVVALPDDGGSPVTDILYRVGEGPAASSGLREAGSFVIPGLANGATQAVRIAAVNARGEGKWSVAKAATAVAPP